MHLASLGVMPVPEVWGTVQLLVSLQIAQLSRCFSGHVPERKTSWQLLAVRPERTMGRPPFWVSASGASSTSTSATLHCTCHAKRQCPGLWGAERWEGTQPEEAGKPALEVWQQWARPRSRVAMCAVAGGVANRVAQLQQYGARNVDVVGVRGTDVFYAPLLCTPLSTSWLYLTPSAH